MVIQRAPVVDLRHTSRRNPRAKPKKGRNPMPSAQPPGWPADKPLAISVNVMLEGWAEGSAPGIGPMGNPLKPGVPDRRRGPGRSTARRSVPGGCSTCCSEPRAGGVLHQRRGRRALSRPAGGNHRERPCGGGARLEPGHSCRRISPTDDERDDIARCVAVLRRAAGQRPGGWLSPRCTPSAHTSRLLARAGFRWHADTFDADLP